MVHLVLELLEAGVSVEEIVGPSYYPQLAREHIQAALHYAGELLKTREYASRGMKACFKKNVSGLDGLLPK